MSKIRRWLYPAEAESLGLKPKKPETNDCNRNQARYYITKEQHEQVKASRSNTKGIVDSCDTLEVDPKTVKHLWKKTKDESIFIKNPLYVSQLEKTCLLYTSPSPRDRQKSRMPSSA